jgi:hypothetical protein
VSAALTQADALVKQRFLLPEDAMRPLEQLLNDVEAGGLFEKQRVLSMAWIGWRRRRTERPSTGRSREPIPGPGARKQRPNQRRELQIDHPRHAADKRLQPTAAGAIMPPRLKPSRSADKIVVSTRHGTFGRLALRRRSVQSFLGWVLVTTSPRWQTGLSATTSVEGVRMKTWLLLIVGLACSAASLPSQGKRVVVVQPFTLAAGVELPYDIKLLQAQLVADLKVQIGKEFDIVAEPPAAPQGSVYTLDGEITGWRPGNAAKRIVIGLGAGREATDLNYRVIDSSGQKVIDRKDTIRTNFYSQGAGSVGTLVHPIAQKIAERLKDAKLK